MEKESKRHLENKKEKKMSGKKSILTAAFASILKIGLAAALLIFLSIIVNAGDVTVGIGDVYTEKNSELFLSLKNIEANGHDYRLVSAGSVGGIGVGKFAVYDATAGLTRMVIDSDGDVGIGTTGPNYKLEIAGSQGSTGLRGHSIEFTRPGANYVEAIGAGSSLGLNANSYLSFMVGGAATERMRITSEGNVGIGTLPNKRLHVSGPDNDWQAVFRDAGIWSGTGGSWNRIVFGAYSPGFDVTLNTNGADRLVVKDATGSVGIGTTTPAAGYKLDVSGKIHATDDICTDVGGKCLSTASGGSVAWSSITGKPAGFSDDVDNVGISSETDPEVGTLTANKWCKAKTKSDGITLEVECSQNAPIMSEFDPEVDTVIDGKWCKGYLGAVRCDYLAPVDSDWTISGNDMYSSVSGKVGIGAASPKTKLDVAGEVKFGNTGLTCNSDAAGAIRYNSGSKVMEFCDGSAWKAIDQNTGSTGGGGTTPPPQTSCPEQQKVYSLTLGPDSASAKCQPNVQGVWRWISSVYNCVGAGWGNSNSYTDGSKSSYVACPWTDTIPAGSIIKSIVVDPVNAGNYQDSGLADWYLNDLLLLNNDDLGTTDGSCSTADDQPNPITITDATSLSKYKIGASNNVYIYKQANGWYILNGDTSKIDVKVSYTPPTC